jgi:hypothetical protein
MSRDLGCNAILWTRNSQEIRYEKPVVSPGRKKITKWGQGSDLTVSDHFLAGVARLECNARFMFEISEREEKLLVWRKIYEAIVQPFLERKNEDNWRKYVPSKGMV